MHARKELLIADKAQRKFAEDAQEYAYADQMEAESRRIEASTDRKRVTNDELEIQIAELEGKSTTPAANEAVSRSVLGTL